MRRLHGAPDTRAIKRRAVQPAGAARHRKAVLDLERQAIWFA
jgi:nicotinate-nucleotide pyrophosphorylase